MSEFLNMSNLPVSSGAILAAIAILLLFVKILQIGRRAPGLPPGPPTIPLLGNLHLVCPVLHHRLTVTDLHPDALQKAPSAVSEMGTRIWVRETPTIENDPADCPVQAYLLPCTRHKDRDRSVVGFCGPRLARQAKRHLFGPTRHVHRPEDR
jgi:hypothetical protein